MMRIALTLPSLTGLALLLVSSGARAQDTAALLKAIEKRYNSAQTLVVDFTETFSQQGRPKITESGTLYLRKPGKMRWEYTKPAGKLFLSDGKFVWFYSPSARRAEKAKMKETEDMRAPLAFLLGKLDFARDFQQYRTQPAEGGLFWITALPKSDKAPYTDVTFLTGADGAIRRLIVTGQDRSILEFSFSNEHRNPPVSEKMFSFALPAGIEFVDLTAR
jgi:outer membrane lipoprotein carrier protein